MKKAMITVALILAVPALIALAQPGPEDRPPGGPPPDRMQWGPGMSPGQHFGPGNPGGLGMGPDQRPFTGGPGAPGMGRPGMGGPGMNGPGMGGPWMGQAGPGGFHGGPGGFGGGAGAGMRMPLQRIPLLEALDANHDGVIDETEIANASAALKKLDKNGDGKLTREEYLPKIGQRGQGRMGRPDAGEPDAGPPPQNEKSKPEANHSVPNPQGTNGADGVKP